MKKKLIAMRILALRQQHNHTQEYVAEVLGIHQSAYSALENGKTALSVEAADKLAQLYGLSLDEFLHPCQPVLNMHGSNLYEQNAPHARNQPVTIEEQFKRYFDILDGQTMLLKNISGQLAMLSELLSKLSA